MILSINSFQGPQPQGRGRGRAASDVTSKREISGSNPIKRKTDSNPIKERLVRIPLKERRVQLMTEWRFLDFFVTLPLPRLTKIYAYYYHDHYIVCNNNGFSDDDIVNASARPSVRPAVAS